MPWEAAHQLGVEGCGGAFLQQSLLILLVFALYADGGILHQLHCQCHCFPEGLDDGLRNFTDYLISLCSQDVEATSCFVCRPVLPVLTEHPSSAATPSY